MKTLNEKKKKINEQKDADVAIRQLLYALNHEQIEGAKKISKAGTDVLEIYLEGSEDPVMIQVKGFSKKEQ